MSKIKLTGLSAYFPYKVKAIFNETDKKGCRKKVIGTVSMIYDNCSINCYDTVNSCPDKYKLILYPPYVTTRQDMVDRKSTRLNSSHSAKSRMPSSA